MIRGYARVSTDGQSVDAQVKALRAAGAEKIFRGTASGTQTNQACTGELGTETREISSGLNVDLDANGDVVGFDIDHASRKLDLTSLETIALPLHTAKVA